MTKALWIHHPIILSAVSEVQESRRVSAQNVHLDNIPMVHDKPNSASHGLHLMHDNFSKYVASDDRLQLLN